MLSHLKYSGSKEVPNIKPLLITQHTQRSLAKYAPNQVGSANIALNFFWSPEKLFTLQGEAATTLRPPLGEDCAKSEDAHEHKHTAHHYAWRLNL